LSKALEEKGFRIVSGGTDTHLILVDLQPKNLTGAQLEEALESANITVNKNMIPFDPKKPMVTSGIRIGTTASTIRGMKEEEMKVIANIINEVAENVDDNNKIEEAKSKVHKLSSEYPLYSNYFKDY